MTKKLLIGVFSLWLLLTGCTAPSGNNGESRGDPVSIMFLGDTYFGESYSDEQREEVLELYGYEHSIEKFKEILQSADHVVANLETTVTERTESPFEGVKDYVHWTDKNKVLQIYRDYNILNFSLANNHAIDYGEEGLKDTISNLESDGFKVFGAGDHSQAHQPLVLKMDGKQSPQNVYIIGGFEYRHGYERSFDAYTEEGKEGVNELTDEGTFEQIRYLKQFDPESLIVVFPHWGDNYGLRSRLQRDAAERLIDAGADLIIGHGSHLVQEVEQYKGKWIVYSIGNFVFNSPGMYGKYNLGAYSMIANLIVSDDLKFRLYPIFTNNKLTDYQSRFVTEEEFDEVVEFVGNEKFFTGKDRHGLYLEIIIEGDLY